jgi:hypothetical protein
LQLPFLTFALFVFAVTFPVSAEMKDKNSLSHPVDGICNKKKTIDISRCLKHVLHKIHNIKLQKK